MDTFKNHIPTVFLHNFMNKLSDDFSAVRPEKDSIFSQNVTIIASVT